MLQWAKDWAVDKIYGAAKTGIEAGGTMAGDAVGGAGTLIENSGRNIGNSASGMVGGVGNYINSYGTGIKDSMAASGPTGSAEKKTAVKPTHAVKEAPKTAQKALPAATSTVRSLPSSRKALRAPKRTPSPKNPLPSKPPQPANRTLPTKKPTASQSAKPATSNLPKISSSAADRTPDGKIRISSASRPQPVKSNIANEVSKPKAVQNGSNGNGNGHKPLPKISAGKNDRTPDGKIRISAASRPRPAVRAH